MRAVSVRLLVLGAARHHPQRFRQRWSSSSSVLQVELHAAGLDLRHVEDVVDDFQQILPALADVAAVFLILVGAERRRTCRFSMISEKPMMALSGVRSSWLILARNFDLVWLASSARFFSSDVFLGEVGELAGLRSSSAARSSDR